MFLQPNYVQFRAVGILPVLGFVFEDRIGRTLSSCFCTSKRKETAYNRGVTYQAEHCGYNRKENKRRNKLIKIIFIKPTVRGRVSVMSCDTSDHKAGEIRSNKARVTLQLDESTDV